MKMQCGLVSVPRNEGESSVCTTVHLYMTSNQLKSKIFEQFVKYLKCLPYDNEEEKKEARADLSA